MDWQRFTQDALTATELEDEALEDFLQRLGLEANERRLEVTDFLARRRLSSSFMQTGGVRSARDKPMLESGTRVGIWRITGLIGAGGMGEVYEAERADGLFEQTTALKLVGEGDSRLTERFHSERQRLARMDHPGISRIIDGGVDEEGRPYMVVELVDGEPIDQYVASNGVSKSDIVRCAIALCAAAGHAHGRFVLHRDIKPANVLVDRDGNVRLIDFGVASLLDTEESRAAGPLTIPYAAPEQLRGEALTVATDVFAIGALLHDLLLKRPPERLADGSVRIDAVGLADQDLAAVVQRATAANPEDRYQSADALADDLAASLERRPVAARKGGAVYRSVRLIQRFPVASVMTAAFILALAVGLGMSLALADRAREEAGRATEERDRAVAALERAEYFQARSERAAETRLAYADALQRAFGAEGDPERLTSVLLERWSEAHEGWRAAPDRAAHISLALGENFVERNDYISASKVLEPWIEAGYGEEPLRVEGKLNLAIAYRYSGRRSEALPLFDEVADRLAETPEAMSMDRVVAVVNSATIRREPEELASAEALLVAAIDDGAPPETMSYYWNATQSIRSRLGDLDGAHQAAAKVVELLDANPLTAAAGRNTARLNLATFEVFHRPNPERAEALLDTVLGEDAEAVGMTGGNAAALRLKAVLAAQRGDFEAAEALFAQAVELVLRFGRAGSYPHLMTEAHRIEALITAGRYDEASEALAVIRETIAGARPDGKGDHPRLVLTEAYLVARSTGPDAATEYFASQQGFPIGALRRDASWGWCGRRLEGLGVRLPVEIESS